MPTKLNIKPYESPNGFHRHKCTNCNFIWEHSNACAGDTDLHTCPNCKEEQWVWYEGPDAPTDKKVVQVKTEESFNPNEKHPSHKTRISMDASSFDEICLYCGAKDQVPGGWGNLTKQCPHPNGPEKY